MARDDYARKGVIYKEVQDEKALRRGTGLMGLISELDWLLSLELEEGKPLDETKITTGIKISVFSTGLSTGFMVNSLVFFGLSTALIFFLWGAEGLPLWFPTFGWLFIYLISITVKLLVPWWFVNTYYLYPKGVVYTYLEWFLWGYALGIFLPELFFLFLSAVAEAIVFFMEGTSLYQKIYPYLEKYAPTLLNPWWLLLELAIALLAFLPPFILYLYKKFHPLGKYPWLPLDFIPDDETDEKELEKWLKRYNK